MPLRFKDEEDFRRQYVLAAGREHFERPWAFQMFTETVGEYELLQMNLFHYNTLRLWNSPFLPPFETPEPEDIWQFLWLLSPDYKPGQNKAQRKFYDRCRKKYEIPNRPARWLLRFKFFRSFYKTRRKLSLYRRGVITKQIRDFVNSSLADRPPRVEINGIARPQYYSDLASMFGEFAREYGGGLGRQQIEEFMRTPMKILFQLRKEIVDATNSQLPPSKWTPQVNPSDEIKGAYLDQLAENARN